MSSVVITFSAFSGWLSSQASSYAALFLDLLLSIRVQQHGADRLPITCSTRLRSGFFSLARSYIKMRVFR